MRKADRSVAAVVNEFGETIGILTQEDLLQMVIAGEASRTARQLRTAPIIQAGPDRWRVLGITTRRRLAQQLDVELPECKSLTVAGITQEMLQRMPEAGDAFDWGPFHWKILDVPERGEMTVELLARADEEEELES